MTDYDSIWRMQDEIRTVVNAVLGECIWDLRYNDHRMAIELELTIVLGMPEVMDERGMVYGEVMEVSSLGMDRMAIPDMGFIKESVMEQKRTTPEFITELQPNEIFVFGSNLKGMHGGGAAYIAYRKFGAIMGQGVGLQGQSYGIPTMQGGVETIRPYVDEFIAFAKEHPKLTFLVTRIGCGIAGFTDEEIAPLFEQAHEVENIVLPEGW